MPDAEDQRSTSGDPETDRMTPTVAVTGAGGYVGGRVMGALGAGGRAVVRSPVPWLPQESQHLCDLLDDPATVAAALRDVTTVIHLAGHNEVVARSDPSRALHETVTMAQHLAEAARRAGTRRIVYVSSVHVYGDGLKPGARIDETLSPAPTSPYAQARARCEEVLAAATDVEVVSLRLTNAVGAPADPAVDRWSLVATELCLQGVLDRTATLRSPGLQSRDFITLDDAVRSIVGACDATVLPPGVYNLSSGRSSSIRSLAELVQDRVEAICGWRPRLEAPDATGPGDDPYVVDPGRLAEHGLVADQRLDDGIDDIIEHCKNHETALRRHWRRT